MSSPFSAPLAPQDLTDGIVGPKMGGAAAVMILYGVFIHVVLVYYQSELYKRDGIYTKVVMWVIFALCTAVVALCVEESYRLGVSQHRDLFTFLAGSNIIAVQALFTGFTAFVVQLFLIHRAAKLFVKQLQKAVFLMAMGAVSLLSLIGCVLTAIEILAYVQNTRHFVPIEVVGGIWLWASAAVDIFISTALFFNLWSHIAGFNTNTDSVLVRLIHIALRTAAYTAIPSVCGAILSFAIPRDSLRTMDTPIAFWMPLSPLYGLSIFTTLAVRDELRNRPLTPVSFQRPMSAASQVDGMLSRPANSNRLSKALSVASEVP